MTRDLPRPPVTLPPYIFLLPDRDTQQLAVDVADTLQAVNNTVYIDDFLAPIHEGLRSMLDLDNRRDLASPSSTNRLVVESEGGQTEQDLIHSLERWFNEEFDDHYLGKLGYKRAVDNHTNYGYTILFRDATEQHVKSFVDNVGWTKLLFVQLCQTLSWSSRLAYPESRWIAPKSSIEATIKAIQEQGQ